ncbi:radical SAM protein [bacterium]|nr:radical SAM protein [bacterium]
MKIIPVFLPYLGCETRCVYCNQKIATGSENIQTPIEVRKFLNKAYKNINGDFLIGFYAGTFLNIPEKLLKNYLTNIPKNKDLLGIRLSTTVGSVTQEKIDILKKYFKNIEIELGIESMDKEVQIEANRIYVSPKMLNEKINLLRKNNIEYFIHLMTGLPKDSSEKFLKTARIIAKTRPLGIRIHPTIVLKDTKLQKLFNEGKYIPQDLYIAAELIAKSVDIFKKKDIKITRLGLFPDLSLQKKGNVIAGPFHPAFGSIVYSFYYRNILEKRFTKEGNYTIYSPDNIKSYINGFKRINHEYFSNKGIHFTVKKGKRLLVKNI